MFNIYLSNRLENLSSMLSQVLKFTSGAVFDKQYILVQHKGMQHWLLMQLAQQQNIAMNLKFEPPGSAIWNILRELDPSLTKESPYKSVVMTWRIYELLGQDEIINDDIYQQANHYWQNQASHKQGQARFQLAKNIADLYEQYQIYRPEWIMAWSEGRCAVIDEGSDKDSLWQGKLWRRLIEQEPRHPVGEMLRLMAEIKAKKEFRPKQRILFGFNSLPPLWLNFFQILAKKQDMHLFLLNPCDEFWSDIKSEKQQARQRVKWLDTQADLDKHLYELNNPLLSSLGQHGQGFLKLLYDVPQNEVSAFHVPIQDKPTMLQRVQSDILQLSDGRTNKTQVVDDDDSIVISSSHSALREVQCLHDWLLHQFNDDDNLTPKDVLVMCPSVEDYAPYVEAIFSRARDYYTNDLMASTTTQAEKNAKIPCSIADRRFSFNMPLIQLFSQLLQLPDNRFTVNSVLETMRSPYVQKRFAWQDEDINKVSRWLRNAAIHWGLDADHKMHFDLPKQNTFSWHQGLERLLLGFAQCDEDILIDEQLLLGDIEGEDAILLGRLMQFIDSLKYHSQHMAQERSIDGWKDHLLQVIDDLFELEDQPTLEYRILTEAVSELHKHAHSAGTSGLFDLAVIQEYFNQAFNQPQQSQHFMTGQVTFCSMIPMRSIPFKVIVILGMNDGDFPRIKDPNALDLLAKDKPKLGDRSRRGDDRYLFLECLLSARDKLYISYQGHNIKDNSERQPSSVLLELLDYLNAAYDKSHTFLQNSPMQAFSKDNYQGDNASFAKAWLELGRSGQGLWRKGHLESVEAQTDKLEINAKPEDDGDGNIHLSLKELIRFFDDPAKNLAQNQLGLYFEQAELKITDSEPFASNHLDRYKFQQALIEQRLKGEDSHNIWACALASGHLPDTLNTENELDEWQQQANNFADLLIHHGVQQSANFSNDTILSYQEIIQNSKKNAASMLKLAEADIVVSGELVLKEQRAGATMQQVMWRLADPKGKDVMRLYLHHLLANIDKPCQSLGFYRDKKKNVAVQLSYDAIDISEARYQLEKCVNYYFKGQTQALLVHAEIARDMFSHQDKSGQIKPYGQSQFDKLWRDDFRQQGLAYNEYSNYFWPKDPPWHDDNSRLLNDVYEHAFLSCQRQNIE